MDDSFEMFLKAVGIRPTEQKNMAYWINKALAEGRFMYRKTASETLANCALDMGRGMQFWVYVQFKGDIEKYSDFNVEPNVHYFMPAYEGEARCRLSLAAVYADPSRPSAWWGKFITQGVRAEGEKEAARFEFAAPIVNFLEIAERIQGKSVIEASACGLVLSYQGAPPEGEPKELIASPSKLAPALMRGKTLDFSRTANFQTGEPLRRLLLECGKTKFNLLGHAETFEKEPAIGDYAEVFAFLQVFAPKDANGDVEMN